MKKIKLTYYLVMLLSLISLVSVGFASWSVTDNLETSVSGMIVVDDVMKVNDFIVCDSENVESFKYYKTGFVKNGQISNVGTITASITVNIEKCKTTFKDSNTLVIELYLESDILPLLNSNEISTGVVINGTEINPGDKNDGKICFVIYELEDIDTISSNIINLDVTYTFTIKEGSNQYFADNVYPILLHDSFNFTLSARLTGEVSA